MDAIEILLQHRQHPTAQKLLDFHHANDAFFLNFAAEFFWLKKRGRPGAAKSLLMFLRQKRWHGVDSYMVNDLIFPLLSRVCILLYPHLNNGTLRLRQCEADEILGTTVKSRKGKTILHAGEVLRAELAELPPMPTPPEITRRSKRRRTVKPEQCAFVFSFIKELVDGSPHPRARLLIQLKRHAKAQPEIFALADMRARRLPRKHFSALDVLTYAKQTAQRGAERRSFTMPSALEGLYCRALIRRNPQLSGWAEIKEDSRGKRKGRVNALLGCYPAAEPVSGEPHPRLHWLRDAEVRG